MWRSLIVLLALAGAPPDEEAKALLEKGRDLNARGQYAEAQHVLRDLARRFPDGPEGAAARDLTTPNRFLRVKTLQRSGPSANRVDVFILAEGFRHDRQGVFDDSARFVLRRLLQSDVFEAYKTYLNVHQMNIASAEDQVSTPKERHDTALEAYLVNTIHRQVAVNRQRVLEFLGRAPEAEGLAFAVVKNGQLGTGGGGIATVGGKSESTVLHEWGHAFAGLADEYNSDLGESGPGESSGPGPNVAFTRDPKLVPWRHWLEAGAGSVGVFVGAAGRATGAWKAVGGGCIMDNGADFCLVCREAVVLALYRRVRPIDESAPVEPVTLRRDGVRSFWVTPLRPASHALKVEWFLHRRDPKVQEGGLSAPRAAPGRRRPLPVRGDPIFWDWGAGEESKRAIVTLRGRELPVGSYVLTVRVFDPTPTDNGFPWVLSDPERLLEARVEWPVEVTR